MLTTRLGFVASCLALLAAPAASTVYISTPPNNCSAYDEIDVDTSACLANKINEGGIGILVIDQQVSFHPGGSLAIATANDDAARIAAFISNHTAELDQVVLTMDSHQRYHIAHGIFWQNATGDSPEPYTTIYAQNISDGVWKPRDASLHDYVLEYAESLEANGQFSLSIWPEHCLIGSPGHNIVTNVLDAALEWTKETLKPIQYIMKGSNPFTEHYSALRAEYVLPYDPSTR
jgi:nicotinamidase/pyrazinamidase